VLAADESDRFQIGEFVELVGLSIPQLRRYDRLRLLAPEGADAVRLLGPRFAIDGSSPGHRPVAVEGHASG
jgi:hypothetical protein